jgi:hypothetical protein
MPQSLCLVRGFTRLAVRLLVNNPTAHRQRTRVGDRIVVDGARRSRSRRCTGLTAQRHVGRPALFTTTCHLRAERTVIRPRWLWARRVLDDARSRLRTADRVPHDALAREGGSQDGELRLSKTLAFSHEAVAQKLRRGQDQREGLTSPMVWRRSPKRRLARSRVPSGTCPQDSSVAVWMCSPRCERDAADVRDDQLVRASTNRRPSRPPRARTSARRRARSRVANRARMSAVSRHGHSWRSGRLPWWRRPALAYLPWTSPAIKPSVPAAG